MDFIEIAKTRQSCRKYNINKNVEDEKIMSVLNAAVLSPSACNSQPYEITVCKGNSAKEIADAVQGMGMNRFANDVPVFLVITEGSYNTTAGLGAKVKNNDYRSIDIGILSAYITAEATSQGLGSCILGWFDDKKIRKICRINSPVRLVITLGYPSDDDNLRTKKRKSVDQLVKFIND